MLESDVRGVPAGTRGESSRNWNVLEIRLVT
jgi:hypothetical protein